ncbi:MAG: NAD-dependent epimerase/dehydratase family protein [Anaerolineales bacterium]|nr:NAD-dependent epimerase/dehydratase family protein [Anaerolineales bacterium]
MTRFLVTGGAGFIGAALSNRLVTLGHFVRVLDDLSAGVPERLHPDVVFQRGDVRDVPKMWTLLQDIDCVYHLAAKVSVQESINFPSDYNGVNVGGTVALMEAMRVAGQVRRVILASSGAVYGEQGTQPIDETAIPQPRSPYAVSKLASEYYVRTLGVLNQVETAVLRIFNAYGPGQVIPPSNAPVLPLFLHQAVGDGSLALHGDGTQSRDFIYIDDVVEAMVQASLVEGLDGSTINVGSGQETTIHDLVSHIARVTGKEVDKVVLMNGTGGVSRLVSSTELAQLKLGVSPRFDLKMGLEQMLLLDPQFNEVKQKSH